MAWFGNSLQSPVEVMASELAEALVLHILFLW